MMLTSRDGAVVLLDDFAFQRFDLGDELKAAGLFGREGKFDRGYRRR